MAALIRSVGRRGQAHLAALLAVTGCGSFVQLDSARTTPAGTTETLIAPSAYVGRRDGTASNADFMFRRGLSKRVDFGARVRLVGAGLDVKVQLLRADDPTRGVDLAVAAGAGYGQFIEWTDSGGRGWAGPEARLSLLTGVNLGPNQLTVTPELQYLRVENVPGGVLNLGATLAFGRMFGPGFSAYPALAIWKSLDAGDLPRALTAPGALAFQPTMVFRHGW